jgi:hypothetical protein
VAVVLATVPVPHGFSLRVDIGRVVQCLMLTAHADGVGSCIGVFEPEASISRAQELVAAPDEWRVELAVSLGVPADDTVEVSPQVSPPGRIPLKELLFTEQINGRPSSPGDDRYG